MCSSDLNEGEECEDGNTDPGDGCSATCTLECGNGLLDLNELCDDGDSHGGDGCTEGVMRTRDRRIDVQSFGVMRRSPGAGLILILEQELDTSIDRFLQFLPRNRLHRRGCLGLEDERNADQRYNYSKATLHVYLFN